jgi:hypothetical protein
MSGGPYSLNEPNPVPVHDVFPDAIGSDEVDQRIQSAETRIKFWVVACVATNLVLALPTIFYMGRMAQSVEEMSGSVKDLQSNQKVNDSWVRDRLVWEAKMEVAMKAKGIVP